MVGESSTIIHENFLLFTLVICSRKFYTTFALSLSLSLSCSCMDMEIFTRFLKSALRSFNIIFFNVMSNFIFFFLFLLSINILAIENRCRECIYIVLKAIIFNYYFLFIFSFNFFSQFFFFNFISLLCLPKTI